MSGPIKTELVNFKDLENEPSAERRSELMRHVATLFSLTSETCSQEQMDIYDSVLIRLADMVEQETRAHVAEKIAKLRRAPNAIIRKLAQDEIQVAKPVLTHSVALTNQDLVEISSRFGQDHLTAIAGRDVLPEEVTDVLVARGNSGVRHTVADNHGARFSDRGFTILVESAQRDEELQMKIGQRADVPDAIIEKLVESASETVRAALIEKGQIGDLRKVSDAARIAAQRMSNDFWLSRYDFESAWTRALPDARSGKLDEMTLRRLATEDRFADVVAVYSILCGISLEDAKHWLVRTDTDPFVIVSRASDLSLMTIQDLLKCGPWRYRLGPEKRQATLQRFQKLTPHVACKLLEQWRAQVVAC